MAAIPNSPNAPSRPYLVFATAGQAELDASVAPVFADLGFPHFAAGRFFRPDRSEHARLLPGSLPREWVIRYVARKYGCRSSIARELLQRGSLYSWSGAIARADDPQGTRIWKEARDFGLKDSLYVRMRGAEGSFQTIVLSGPRPEVSDPFVRIVAKVVAGHYGAQGRRLLGGPQATRPLLSPRQRDCLLWVRAGKSSPTIGLSWACLPRQLTSRSPKPAASWGCAPECRRP
jgi:hypothetical protein